MAVELVIKIPEEDYKSIKKDVKKFLSMPAHYVPTLYDAVDKGIQLPKGHGRVVDASELCEGRVSNDPVVIAVKCAPTIIEADKEYEAEVITRGNYMMCGKELTEGLFFCKECEDKAKQKGRNKYE